MLSLLNQAFKFRSYWLLILFTGVKGALPVDHLTPPDHEKAAVPDVSGVQLEVRVGEHHQARRARADHLGFALLHLTETLTRKKY